MMELSSYEEFDNRFSYCDWDRECKRMSEE